jgi:8-oxo-dGTP diphosphatase
MIGFILFLVSSIIKWVLAPVSYVYGAISSLFKHEFNHYNFNLAIAKDQYGNALCKYVFNDFLITKDGYKFGNVDETISSCIGKNRVKGTLTFLGRLLDWTLDKFEPNHSILSIDETENSATDKDS